ncbi:MAG: alcohol dehydrogenase catalytic domain-containing protein [Desulfobacterales bacterium]
MKTIVLSEYNRPLEIDDREIPRVESGEVLLKVKACGICQTDLKIIRGPFHRRLSPYPMCWAIKWPEK